MVVRYALLFHTLEFSIECLFIPTYLGQQELLEALVYEASVILADAEF